MAQYVKNDCEQGFVTDSAEIENLKLNNMRHTILGCMLGDFDANGKYIVDPEIVKELIAMPKYIVDTVENIEVCSSLIKLDKQITFFVTYEGERVSLILAEKVNFQANFKINSGLFSNINEYVLDSFETSGVVDKNAVYSKWNISQFAGEALDVFDMDEETLSKYFGIVNRFKYLMKANQILLQKEAKLEELEADYAVQMLNLVAKFPELKKVVDAKIKDVAGKQPSVIRLDKPFFAKTINEIISQAVEENVDVLPPDKKQEFEVEKRNIIVEHNEKLKQEIEVANLPIVDEQQDVVGSKYVLDTMGVDKKQSLKDVATEFIATQKEVGKQIVQEAVLETVDKNVQERFAATTGAKLNQPKDELVGKIAEIVGQTKKQFSANTTEETTQEIASTLTEKTNTLKSAQIQSETAKLVTKAVEANQAAAKAAAATSVKPTKATATKKPTVVKPKATATAKATAQPASDSNTKATETTKPAPVKVHDFGDRPSVSIPSTEPAPTADKQEGENPDLTTDTEILRSVEIQIGTNNQKHNAENKRSNDIRLQKTSIELDRDNVNIIQNINSKSEEIELQDSIDEKTL